MLFLSSLLCQINRIVRYYNKSNTYFCHYRLEGFASLLLLMPKVHRSLAASSKQVRYCWWLKTTPTIIESSNTLFYLDVLMNFINCDPLSTVTIAKAFLLSFVTSSVDNFSPFLGINQSFKSTTDQNFNFYES